MANVLGVANGNGPGEHQRLMVSRNGRGARVKD